MNIQTKNDSLSIYPIGGVEEIGSNTTIYKYKNTIITIDYGITLNTLDDLTPHHGSFIDLLYFYEKQFRENNNIHLIITHCHDDHIGGLKLLSQLLRNKKKENLIINIYLSNKFNHDIILSKYPKTKHNQIRLHLLGFGKYNTVGDFKFAFFQVEHSIEYSSLIHLKTTDSEYKIVHSGDWRFDSNKNKTCHSLTSFKYLKGDCNIVINESTKIYQVTANNCVDEAKMEVVRLCKEFLKKNKNIYIVLFASNIDRVIGIIEYAMQFGFPIMYMGNTLGIFIKTAYSNNLISEKIFNYIKGTKSIDKVSSKDVKIKIVSGCQNEKNSVLNRLAYSSKKYLTGNDVVIFSSFVIPSLRKRVDHLIKMLYRHNVEIVNIEEYPKIHASGHATRKDIILMYDILKPKLVIPVHGDVIKIHKHFNLIKKMKMLSLFPRYLKYFVISKKENNLITKSFDINKDNIINYYSLDYEIYKEGHNTLIERKNLILGGVLIVDVKNKKIYTIGTDISKDIKTRIEQTWEKNAEFISRKHILNISGFKGEVILVS